MQLTPLQIGTLETLEKKIDHGKHAFVEVGKCLMRIREERLYLRDYDSFEAYCQGRWGWGVKRAQQLVRASEFWSEQKALADAGQTVTVPQTESEARTLLKKRRAAVVAAKPIEVQVETQRISMTARIDPEAEAVFMPPPPNLARPLTQFEVIRHLNILEREMKSLLMDGAFAMCQKFRHAVHEVELIRASLAMELPGMICAESPRAKARGTLGEIENFCESVGLPTTDGTWFFNRCEGCGWKNGQNPIKDWKATVRAWHAAGYFPSQKRNGALVQPTLADQSRRKIQQAVKAAERV